MSSVSNGLHFLTLPLVSVMRVIYRKIRHARYIYIKRNVEKVWGAHYILGARYLSKNTVLLAAQNRKHGVPESDCFLLDVSVCPSGRTAKLVSLFADFLGNENGDFHQLGNSILIRTSKLGGRDSSVGIGRSGDRLLVGARFSKPVQTGPGAHPASYTTVTGSFPGVKRPGRDVEHPPHLVPRLKKE